MDQYEEEKSNLNRDKEAADDQNRKQVSGQLVSVCFRFSVFPPETGAGGGMGPNPLAVPPQSHSVRFSFCDLYTVCDRWTGDACPPVCVFT